MSEAAISIRAFKIKECALTLVGDSPLVTHAWSSKAREMMKDKQAGKAKKGREVRNPHRDYCDSLYWLTPRPSDEPTAEEIAAAKFGFPVVAFKAAAVDACSQLDKAITKVQMRGAFHVNGEFAEIIGKPKMREDMVRVGMGTSDLRYRAEFTEWKVVLPLRVNVESMSVEQVVNMFNLAGFACGVGEYRPQKDGSWGMFHVESCA